MSIIQRVPGTRLMPLNGMSSQLISQTLDLEATTVPTTLVSECVGALPVFGDLFSDDLQNNDFSSFLTLQFPGRTVEYFLLGENCEEIAQLNDSTYGTYYPTFSFPVNQGYTFLQSRYVGYKLEWQKVLNLHGVGTYKIKQKTTFPDLTVEEECPCFFELLQYSNSFADETVRIETTQNGYIIGEGLDYTNTNWTEQIRIPGFFGNKQRRLEQDNYLDKNRRTTQIQDSLIHEFTLEPYFWPDCLRDQIDSILLANEILISDYNIDNTDDLKNISVIPTTIETEYFGKSNKAADEIKFEERRKNRVKTKCEVMETLEGCILSYAKEFVGKEEIPGNKGFKDKDFDALIRHFTTFKNGHAWCVYFCWLCWQLSYTDFCESFEIAKAEFSGGAVRTFRHFREIGWTSKTPEVGSIAIWQKYRNGSATAYGHAAIVEYWDENYIFTIDGNTNDNGGREGYIVADGKKRSIDFKPRKNGLVLKGFIHPKI